MRICLLWKCDSTKSQFCESHFHAATSTKKKTINGRWKTKILNEVLLLSKCMKGFFASCDVVSFAQTKATTAKNPVIHVQHTIFN